MRKNINIKENIYMSKKKNTNTEEILEHSNQLLSDETIDTEQKKKEALLPEYEHMLYYASDDKNKDIILKGYAISHMLALGIESYGDFGNFFIDYRDAEVYHQIFKKFSVYDPELKLYILRKELEGYSFIQLRELLTVTEKNLKLFNKNMSVRQMRKIKYNRTIVSKYDPLIIPDIEKEENEILNMCLDENLKARIKMEGNLKDNLLDLCERLISSGIEGITCDFDRRIEPCLSIGYATCIIQKYRLFDQAPTLLSYYNQEFPILNEKVIKKCQDIYLTYGVVFTDMGRPLLKEKLDNNMDFALDVELDTFLKEQIGRKTDV